LASVHTDMNLNISPVGRAEPLFQGVGLVRSPMVRLSWSRRYEAPLVASSKRPAPVVGQEIREALDDIAATIRNRSVEAGVRRLRTLLCERRRSTWFTGWQILARTVVREHPVLDLIHESPLSNGLFAHAARADNAFDPAWDAVARRSGATRCGRRIAACELEGDTFRAMRARRDLFATAMDAVGRERRDARVLAIAGDRVEAGLANAARRGPLDLICAGSGYERLSDANAATLTARLFSMLASRGRLLVGAISPDVSDRAYLEACMDWWMTCRDEAAVGGLVATIPADDVASLRTFPNETRHVVFLEVVRA
jgi:hypothetical protein